MTPSNRRSLLGALALVVLVVAALAGVRDLGFVVDDREYVETNTALETTDGLAAIWTDLEALPHHQYYPLVVTTLWLEHQLWGKEARGYHLVNLVLHLLNAFLVWRLASVLGLRGAWFVAAVFAVHPVQVETVAWVTELKNVLFVAFYLLSALAYLRFADRGGRGRYAAALGLFLLSMLSKTVACTFPVVMALLLWLRRSGSARRHALALTPFVAVAVALGLVAAFAESAYVGASGEQWSETPVERLLIAGRASWFYAGKLLWPVPVAFVYERWDVDAGAPLQWLFPLTALALPVLLWSLRARLGRGPLVAVLFFGVTLAPTLGFVDFYFMRYSYVGDHFQYLALLGPVALVVGVLVNLTERAGASGRHAALALGGGALVAMAALSARQVPAYADDETLWRDTVEKNPSAWVARMFLGGELFARGALDEAILQYEAALALGLEPHPEARVKGLLGAALLGRGETQRAIALFRETLEVKPAHLATHYQLGTALSSLGKHAQSLRHFRVVLGADPRHRKALLALGGSLRALGQDADAARCYEAVLQLAPGDAQARRLLDELRGG
jgi:Flp pilus assembly protein TadD